MAAAIERERHAFADTLDRVGPDAPTLAGDWRARDLAAHVASLDRFAGVPTFLGRSIVARGVRLNDRVARFADASIRGTRRKGFEWAVRRLRAPSPPMLLRPAVAVVGLFEVFVHHEDVRRAEHGAETRPAPAELASTIPWLLRYHRQLLPGVRIQTEFDPSEAGTASDADQIPTVRIIGDLGDIVTWLAGRRTAAQIELAGDESVVDLVKAAPIRI